MFELGGTRTRGATIRGSEQLRVEIPEPDPEPEPEFEFKQIRYIEWIKTNPQPLNSSVNYLTNCREIALLGIKGTKPTFNSKYDDGIYKFPLQGGKNRFHPTQKSLNLFDQKVCIPIL